MVFQSAINKMTYHVNYIWYQSLLFAKKTLYMYKKHMHKKRIDYLINILLQIGDYWLYMKEDETTGMRLLGGKKEVIENNPDYKFKIDCINNNYSLSCGDQFQWKFVVNKDDHRVGFVKEDDLIEQSHIRDLKITMDMTFGEDAF